MDAALASLVRGRVLVVHNGLYCQRILSTLSGFDGVDLVENTASRSGGRVDLDRSSADAWSARHEPDWRWRSMHHETTTGLR